MPSINALPDRSGMMPSPQFASNYWILSPCGWLQIGATVVECAVVIELKDLNGKAKLGGLSLYVQVQKEGD